MCTLVPQPFTTSSRASIKEGSSLCKNRDRKQTGESWVDPSDGWKRLHKSSGLQIENEFARNILFKRVCLFRSFINFQIETQQEAKCLKNIAARVVI